MKRSYWMMSFLVLLLAILAFYFGWKKMSDQQSEDITGQAITPPAEIKPQGEADTLTRLPAHPLETEEEVETIDEGAVETVQAGEYTEPAPEIIAAPASLGDTEISTTPPIAQCAYPGDSYTPHPHGFDPLTDYVEFEYPIQIGGYDGEPLPVLVTNNNPDIQTACVMLFYDVSARGDVINVSVFDVQPELPVVDEYYPKTAVQQLRSRKFKPGTRNGKPVRIDNLFLEVRFDAR
ncbi:MAG: energy transducer TonB [bacterium]